jgi:hypothetical protein
MASSLLLIFFKAAGVTFERVGFLGTELSIARPNVLYYGLWLVWAYFLVRYVQFMMESRDLGIKKAVAEKITKYAKEKFNADNFQDAVGQVINLQVRYLGSLRWALVLETYQVDRGDVLRTDARSFGPGRWLLWAATAFLAVGISSTKITEYLLPLVLAFATAVVGFWDLKLPS